MQRGWCTKSGGVSSTANTGNSCVPRTFSTLPNHLSPQFQSTITDCNSSELLNAIFSFPLSAFTCGTLFTSQGLGARLLKITLCYSFHQPTYVNNMTLELFLTMERELRCHLSSNPDFIGSKIKMNLKQSEDVLFLWSIIGAGWEEKYCTYLLGIVVDMWVCIRGFSQAMAWIEQYKSAQRRTCRRSRHLEKKPEYFSVYIADVLLMP